MKLTDINSMHRPRLPRLFATCLMFLVAGISTAARATNYTVIYLSDAAATLGGAGSGTAGDLRYCVTQANSGPTGSKHTISFIVTGKLTLGGREIVINSDTTINGPGAGNLTIDANLGSRVFYVAPGRTAAISGLSIVEGNGIGHDSTGTDPGGSDFDGLGGAILNDRSTLTVSNCNISDCASSSASSLAGGAIQNWARNGGNATLTVSNCLLTRNFAEQPLGFGGGAGGGINNVATELSTATLNVNDTTISYNRTGTYGGGINSRSFGGGGGGSPKVVTTVVRCTISNNYARGGGGVFSGADSGASATMTMTESTVSQNWTEGFTSTGGGGIFNSAYSHSDSAMTLKNCTVSGNSSDKHAGGIQTKADFFSTADFIAGNCTFSENRASTHGGGLYGYSLNSGTASTVKLNNCTICRNSTVQRGGGIYNGVEVAGTETGVLEVTNCTIAGNSAQSGGGGIANDKLFSGTAGLTISNTILALNTTGANYNSANGTASSSGWNLSDDATCQTFLTASGDKTSVAAGLTVDSAGKPLQQNNGGSVQTVALLANSSAIDAGRGMIDPLTGALTATDERGFSRTVNSPDVSDAPESDGTDIGAFEWGGTAQPQYGWTNFAGLPGGKGNVESPNSSVRFDSLVDMATDSQGNTYVTDFGSHTIRKITSSGVIMTFAGKVGTPGSSDGPADIARFWYPYGVALDGDGNVYVSEYMSYRIRKIATDGTVTTLAGRSGVSGSADGTGANARFGTLGMMAIDSGGSLYVADYGNHTIRKVSSSGVVTTLAGSAGVSGSTDGAGNVARFNNPKGIALDAQGNIYVAEYSNHTIRRVTPAGVVTTVAGLAGNPGSVDGVGSAARFHYPSDVTVDTNGDVYVSDSINCLIRKITADGTVSTVAGAARVVGTADGPGASARFLRPDGLCLDSGGKVLVADDYTIRKVESDGSVSTTAGSISNIGSQDGAGSAARFYGPSGVAVDAAGNIYVADPNNHTIRKITATGVVSTLAGSAGVGGSTDGIGSEARFLLPCGVAVDGNNNIFIADTLNFTIRKISSAGVVTTFAGQARSSGFTDGTGTAARFGWPVALAVDRNGNVYVADRDYHLIRKITSDGVVTKFAGSTGTLGSSDGRGDSASFRYPTGIAVDANGTLYVADSGNSTIRKITSAGVVTTFAGSPGQTGATDGTGANARFRNPSGIAVDRDGNVFVADQNNQTIRKITSAGVVTTVGGTVNLAGGADGIGTLSQFSYPQAIAVSTAGLLYVADESNNRISVGKPTATPAIAVEVASNGAKVADGGSPLDLGQQVVGKSLTMSLVIRNTGGTNLVLNSIAVDGTNASDFTTTNLPSLPYTLIPGGSASLTITCSPKAAGTRTAAVHLASNDPFGVFDLNLMATGTSQSRKAQVTSPLNGSSLATTSLPLVWNAGTGVTGYVLYAGTTPGGYDLYAGNEGTNLSRTLTNLPAGRRIHVTLWSLINGSYQANSYFFEPLAAQSVALTSPSTGSTITGSNLVLTWSSGTGVSKCVVWIGSSPGGYDIAAVDAGSSTARVFTVPQDGGPVYVTLWSLINGGYQSTSYWFFTALPATGNRPARIYNPSNGTQLGYGTLALSWDAGVGASSYVLWVGSTPDGYDIYAGAEGGNTSRDVGIPSDGRRIYVTLHSLIAGAYQSNAYFFTAPNRPFSGVSEITSPGIGTTLSGPSEQLLWNSPTGTTQRYLYIGSSAGSYDLYLGNEGTTTGRIVTGLPTDGRPIYATLYSWLANTWWPSSTWFYAANTSSGNKRALIGSPSNGSALTASSTTFNWSGGVGVTGYALWIGSSSNGYDLWASAEGATAASRTVTLPTDGRKIYVTLYSQISGGWQASSYVYTATNEAITKAAISSPAAKSTLPGASVTFNWSASNSATAYALWIGRKPGAYDIYAGAEGTSLSRTITTLPVDGGPIYVTLYSLIKGAWQSSEAYYTAAPPP